MTDDELWKTRSMLLNALESEREVIRRYGGRLNAAGEEKEKSRALLTGSKRARAEEEEEEEEEGQIRGIEGAPPAKAAKSGYVPPHMRGRGGDARAAPGRSDGDWRGGGGEGGASGVGRADASKDWRRRDDGIKVGASGPKIPVPGERGFGFHSVGLGRGRGSVGGGRDLDGAGAGRTPGEAPNRTVPVPPPPAPRVERFADAPAAPVEPTRQVHVPPPPPPPVEKQKDASPARDAEESEEDDDIEAIQAAAKVATNVKVIEVEIPDPPKPKTQKAADGTATAAAPPPRRSSRRSVSPDRLKMEATAAEPKTRRSSRRSVEPEPSRKSTKTTTKSSSLTPVEGDPSKLTVVVLKELLKERELSTAGLKAALVERLKAALEEESNA